jgi:hypothetical protein
MVNGEESDPVGEELRDFFIDLLRGQNLTLYQSTGRRDYITSKRSEGVIGEEAEALLRTGTLEEIEARIAGVTGSGRAVPLLVVCPPM